MAVDKSLIESLGLFAGLDPRELSQMAGILELYTAGEGEVVAERGSFAGSLFINISGDFLVHFKDGRALTLHEKGDVFGWSTIVGPFEYTATAVALTCGEYLSLPGDKFREIVQEKAALAEKLMQNMKTVLALRLSLIREDSELGCAITEKIGRFDTADTLFDAPPEEPEQAREETKDPS